MTDKLYINGVDAWTQWGVFLEEGSYERLLRGAPMKSPIENKSALQHGKDVYLTSRKVDERDVQVVFCFKKSTDFLTKYKSFIETIQAGKVIEGETYPLELGVKDLGIVYKLVYSECVDMSGMGLIAGKVAVRFNEPNPTNRTAI